MGPEAEQAVGADMDAENLRRALVQGGVARARVFRAGSKPEVKGPAG